MPKDAATATIRNKDVVRRFVEAINRKRWEELDALVSPAVIRHSATSPHPPVASLSDLRGFLQREAETFPDAHERIDFLVAEGDKVAARLTFRATQLGAMGPFPPTGRSLTTGFICVFRLTNGQIAEIWVEWDNLSALVQLGHLEVPARAKAP